MAAMTFMAPPQAWQVSISMLNTRLRHCAQVMAFEMPADPVGDGVTQAGEFSARGRLDPAKHRASPAIEKEHVEVRVEIEYTPKRWIRVTTLVLAVVEELSFEPRYALTDETDGLRHLQTLIDHAPA